MKIDKEYFCRFIALFSDSYTNASSYCHNQSIIFTFMYIKLLIYAAILKTICKSYFRIANTEKLKKYNALLELSKTISQTQSPTDASAVDNF